MLCDKLIISDDKTDLIGTRQQLSKVHIDSLAVGDVGGGQELRVTDSNMSLQANINNIILHYKRKTNKKVFQ